MSLPKVQENKKQEFYNVAVISYQFLTLHSVHEMILISVSTTNLRLLWLGLILTDSLLVRRKTTIDDYLTKRSKIRLIKQPYCHAFGFVYSFYEQ